MASLSQLFNGLALLVLAVGGGAFLIAISMAGFYYLTAFGEPQKMSMAKGALMSSVVGIAIMAFAPFAPRVLNQVVFQPAGLSAIQVDTEGCDGTLRTALLAQRSVNTAARANSMVKQIQAQREDECGSDVWNPVVVLATGGNSSEDEKGFTATTTTPNCGVKSGESSHEISDTPLPAELFAVVKARTRFKSADEVTQGAFARAPDGSMLIEFETGNRPADGSKCWLYIARGNFWDELA